MRKELYEKLNQLDRIEYRLNESNHSIWFDLIGMSFVIATLIVTRTNPIDIIDRILAGIMVMIGVISILFGRFYDVVSNNSLDKHFIKKLDIKSKRETK